MKNLKRFLCSMLLLAVTLGLAACAKETTTTVNADELLSKVAFAQETYEFTYDGSEHAVTLDNLPEGATVTYYSNKQTEPGKYDVSATVKFSGSKKICNCVLIISKINSVLTVADKQELNNFGGVLPEYTLSNDVQELNITPLYIPGTYTLEIYAKETAFYKKSNVVTVTVVVNEANELGVEFSSESIVYDGLEHTLAASNIPEGYTCEYENNSRTEVGSSYAVCKVYDSTSTLALTIHAILTVGYEDNAEFGKWLDDFFVEYLGDDYLAWNIYTADNASFGLVKKDSDGDGVIDKASWYSYETTTQEDITEAYNEFSDYLDELTAFSTKQLSENDMVSYDRIYNFLNYYKAFYEDATPKSLLIDLQYVDSFGGYAADCDTYFRAYTLRKEDDIIDLIDYINSLPDAFKTYVTYVNDRAEVGYALSDYTLSEMISYIDSVTKLGDDYYLSSVICKNIDATTFLTEEQKTTYKAAIVKAFKDSFMPAFEALSTDLASCKGKLTTSEGYWANYGDAAKTRYASEIQDLFGLYDMTMEEYSTLLNQYLKEADTGFSNVYTKYKALTGDAKTVAGGIVSGSFSMIDIEDTDNTASAYIDFLMEKFAPTIVPDLESTPNVDISYMDDSVAAVSNAVAYYMKSALDVKDYEFITLNGLNLKSDLTDTLGTLAHEGYPGHLYEFVYNKELDISNIAKIMTYTGHGEGWATYVTLKLYEYLKDHNNQSEELQDAVSLALDYLYYWQLESYLIYTKIDFEINYNGASISTVKNILESYSLNGGAAENVYKTLIEMPTQYAAYGFGQAYMLHLHTDTEEVLGDKYNEVDFNRVLLSHGWCSLQGLTDLKNQYIKDVQFMYGE